MTMLDRQSPAAIASAVNGGKTSALAVAQETLARLEAYDVIQPMPALRQGNSCRWPACPLR